MQEEARRQDRRTRTSKGWLSWRPGRPMRGEGSARSWLRKCDAGTRGGAGAGTRRGAGAGGGIAVSCMASLTGAAPWPQRVDTGTDGDTRGGAGSLPRHTRDTLDLIYLRFNASRCRLNRGKWGGRGQEAGEAWDRVSPPRAERRGADPALRKDPLQNPGWGARGGLGPLGPAARGRQRWGSC